MTGFTITVAPRVARRRVARAAPAATTIAQWLQHGPAQLRHGPHAGAVAGTLTHDGAALYVYPEIAGYYLQWLAWSAQRGGDSLVLSRSAQDLQAWLGKWLVLSDPPPTRVHLGPDCDDWRNDAVFLFDLAMVLRGLGAAAQERLLEPDAGVVAGIVAQLARLVAADGAFDACVVNRNAAAPPARWSTRRGAFLAKAAAGIITAAQAIPGIPDRIVRAADATLAQSIAALASSPHGESHPLLYACEGILALPRHAGFPAALAVVAREYDALLASADAAGFLPETRGEAATSGPKRVDVLAQAIRVGALLQFHRPRQAPDRIALARVHNALRRQVSASGAVGFAAGDTSRCNVWAAMFADQALAFAAPAREPDASWRNGPLLV